MFYFSEHNIEIETTIRPIFYSSWTGRLQILCTLGITKSIAPLEKDCSSNPKVISEPKLTQVLNS